MRASASVEASRLRFGTVERGDLVRDVAVQGRIVAASHPTLFSPVRGIVTLEVREGERIREGQLLATIESPELESRRDQESATLAAFRSALGRQRIEARQTELQNRQDVDLATVTLEAARRELERAELTFAEGLINRIDYEKAHDDAKIAELELEHAREKLIADQERLAFEVEDARQQVERQRLVLLDVERRLQELEITAPFGGLVATISVEDRDSVAEHQALLGVVDLSLFEIEVGIPEAYADDALPGIAAELRVDGGLVAGTLTRVSPEVQGSQVLGTLEFLDRAPAGLRQNQRVTARLLLEERRGVVKVPRGAFLEGGGNQLYVVRDGAVELRPVRLGATSVTEVEVLEGLEPGDRVVLSDMSRFDNAATILLRD
jgi:HlyD family secretion protein